MVNESRSVCSKLLQDQTRPLIGLLLREEGDSEQGENNYCYALWKFQVREKSGWLATNSYGHYWTNTCYAYSFYYYLCIVCILPAIISTLRAHSMHNNNINIIYIIQIYIYIACTGSYA